MKVSLKWLSEYTAVPEDLKAFCDRLDLTGTGVEGVEKTGEAFEGVVVGHVLTCEPHPDSDHMHVVTVDVGAEEPVQIVCGAPNIAADIKVPVALVGAVLPGDFKIKKSKLRGVPQRLTSTLSASDLPTGTLACGKQADICVLDRNLFTCEPVEVLEATAALTMIAGKVVFEA